MSSINIFGKLRSNFNGYTLNAYMKSKALINASPGPAQIPQRVLACITNEMKGYTNEYQFGNTPLEISHRSPEFTSIMSSLNSNMRAFMKIPDEFDILWTPGGGHGQFAAIPLNLRKLLNTKPLYYAVNGTWSNRAFQESKQFINSRNIFEEDYEPQQNVLQYNTMPTIDKAKLMKNSYLYLCSNETVNGIEFREENIAYPTREELRECKLIVDMSSDFLMKSINWDKIDIAFACSSKNMGVAGANIVIIRKDIITQLKEQEQEQQEQQEQEEQEQEQEKEKELQRQKMELPSILNWEIYSKTGSLYNTPAIFNLYLVDKLLQYYTSIGNIEYINKQTIRKGKIIYDFLDSSVLFSACVKEKDIRSNINIPFIVNNGCVETRNKFLHFCYLNNLVGLRTKTPFSYDELNIIEPLRINLYNGVSVEETKSIANILQKFENLYFT